MSRDTSKRTIGSKDKIGNGRTLPVALASGLTRLVHYFDYTGRPMYFDLANAKTRRCVKSVKDMNNFCCTLVKNSITVTLATGVDSN